MIRWQYHIVNMGMFNAADRMTAAFGQLGEQGWELVAVHDKASNWLTSMEKGFAIFKRPVTEDEEPDGPWARWQYAASVGREDEADALGRNATNACKGGAHDECKRKWCTCVCHRAG